ncbi:unnamed protein product [Brachionus calyciflorus]|uniref:Ammonium transporter n=1 Tax=Brachionus calyciflorus TaxID=104777 RepID=A0A814LKQ6_9BILA|nr:unnamed protein product [Brachionus calyciflorus]
MNFSNFTIESNITLHENSSLFVDLNYSDTLWLMISTALVFMMLPGLGFYYSGYIQRTSTLTIFMSILVPFSCVTIQWFLIGYSLVFSDTGSQIIGNFKYAFLTSIGDVPSKILSLVPSNVFMIYQGLFAGLTPCLFYGAIAERGTISAFILISVLWTTLVYDFIAYWTWNPNGWLNNMGVLDFAGGGPVHVASGFAALAYALVVGQRKNVNFKQIKPINLTEIFLGTCLLWVGWLGFNGGSEGAINSRAINAAVVTNYAAASGGLSWILIEMIFHKTWSLSLNAFCTGALASLVSITPACGYVRPLYAIVIGLLTTPVCFLATFFKKATRYKFDDAVDVFAVHGCGGIIGSLLTGIFAEKSVIEMVNKNGHVKGGFLDGNYYQIIYQLVGICLAAIWSFFITLTLVKLVDVLPFLSLRLDEESEKIGSDFAELGEVAYGIELDDLNANKLVYSKKSKTNEAFETETKVSESSKS